MVRFLGRLVNPFEDGSVNERGGHLNLNQSGKAQTRSDLIQITRESRDSASGSRKIKTCPKGVATFLNFHSMKVGGGKKS